MSLRTVALVCAFAVALCVATSSLADDLAPAKSTARSTETKTKQDAEEAPAPEPFSLVRLNRPVPATRAYAPQNADEKANLPDAQPPIDDKNVAATNDENELEIVGRILVDQSLDDGSGKYMIEDDCGMLRIIPQDAVRSIVAAPDRTPEEIGDKLEKKLLDEFGEGFAVRRAGDFIFVSDASPAYVDWCSRLFVSLNAGFQKFAEKHDLPVKDRAEPLVVVVFATRDAFVRYAAVETPSANMLSAYYSMQTNRVALYDLTLTESGGQYADSRRKRLTLAETREILSRPNAAYNVATVVHEATHQIAFNRGLFLRTGPNELWTVEGLSLVFETPSGRVAQNGWSYRSSFPTNERMKNLYLRIANPSVALFRKVVEQDGFYQNIEASYAASWALFYYLYKRKPRQLFEYLKILAEKYPCALYPKEDRIKDFESVFGDDWEKLARDVDKFVRKS